MNAFGFPILSLICYIPLVSALAIIFLFRKEQHRQIMITAFVVSVINMLVSFLLLSRFDATTARTQYFENADWIPTLGARYQFGIDGISLLLILLTTILTAIAVLSSFSAITERVKEYYVSLLFLETGLLGVFMARDMFLFYIFWELVLVPMYFLIGIWGGGRRLYSAIKFFLYTLFGSLFLLLGILALYFLNASPDYGSGTYSFSVLDWYRMRIPFVYQFWIFLAFFIGFAIKVPMFPFHTWLPDAHTDAPTAGSVLLAGVLLKMGTYGFVRFNLPLFPDASNYFAPFMAALAIIGIIYGALVAMAQKDIKRLVAYSSVSHLGFVMLGLFALNSQGITGAILQMINHGVSTGALFLIVGIVYERRHTRMIDDFGGLLHVTPVFATIFAITMFSSIGLPGLNGFVGEFLILTGVFQYNYLYAAAAVVGIILGAAYMLWLYQRMMLGPLEKEENRRVSDVSPRELAYMLPLILFMFWIGIYPKPYLRLLEPAVAAIVQRVSGGVEAEPASAKGGPFRTIPANRPASGPGSPEAEPRP